MLHYRQIKNDAVEKMRKNPYDRVKRVLFFD
jgi:hypothetical protein